MRLDFDYIIVDDDLKRSRTRRRVEKIQRIIDDKIRSKGLNPKPKLFESLDKFYSLKESLQENKDFVTINRVETLAQIFTDIRYKKSDNEFMSENFIKTLKKQGFLK